MKIGSYVLGGRRYYIDLLETNEGTIMAHDFRGYDDEPMHCIALIKRNDLQDINKLGSFIKKVLEEFAID